MTNVLFQAKIIPMITDLKSIGLDYPQWQDAVEAAIASNRLGVLGTVRDGQHIQFTDPSGAQINILATEPFATYAGFNTVTELYAHVTPVNDVLALIDVLDIAGDIIASLAVNLAQGPLIADEDPFQWQLVGLAGLAIDTPLVHQPTAETKYQVSSFGQEIIAAGDGSKIPDASAHITGRVIAAQKRTTVLTGQEFVHVTCDLPFKFDLCLPAETPVPAPGAAITGEFLLVASIKEPAGCGDGCGSGGCGCGSGGCH